MNTKSSTITIIAIIFLFWGCGTSQKEYNIIKHAEDIISMYPDSVIKLLESISEPQSLDKKERAEYYFLLNFARDQYGISIFKDSLISESVEYYSLTKEHRKTAICYFLRSKSYYDYNAETGDTKKALLDCLEAKKYAEICEDDNLLAIIYQTIGNLYYVESHTREALENFKKSLIYFSAGKNKKDEIILCGKIGSTYNVLKQPDSALVYQQKALDEFLPIANYSSQFDLNIISSLHKNIGYSYRILKNYESEKNEFLKAYQILPDKTGSDANILRYLLGHAYMNVNLPDSAIYYAQQFTEIENESLNNQFLRTHNLYRIYKSANNPVMALENIEIALSLMDQIYEENLAESIMEVERKYDKKVLENQYNELLVHRLYLVIIVIVVLLVAVISALFFVNRIRRKETALLEAEQSLTTFRQLISEQDEKLKNFDRIISENDQKTEKLKSYLIEKLDITRKIAQMNIVTTDNTTDFVRQYNKIFKKNLLDEIEWERIYPVINELYDGFITKIKSEYPELGEKDLQMCCLIRAGFKPEEIAVLLNYTQNTVRVKKSRLGQKLNFSDYDSFLEHIMAV